MKLVILRSVLMLIVLCSLSVARAEDFSVIALPDTQNYSKSYPEIYDCQTQWIVDSLSDYNIKFVTHLGDVVNNNPEIYQWENAKASMTTLDNANVPYGIAYGNHDIRYDGYDPEATNYINYFGPQHYTDKSWYGGASPSGQSNYQIISTDGRDWLFLHLAVETPAQELAWAQNVLNLYNYMPTMVTTHRYLYDYYVDTGRFNDLIYETVEAPYRHDGVKAEAFFENFIQPNRQIYAVICGHVHNEFNQTSYNYDGLPVHEMLADYQDDTNGGNGYLRIMQFDQSNDQIYIQSYSPYLNEFNTDTESQFTIDVNFDQYPSDKCILRFQNGYGDYSSTEDTWIDEDNTGTNHGSSTTLTSDDDTDNHWWYDYEGQALIKFGDLFGNYVYEGQFATQIPPNATIISATLKLVLDDDVDIAEPDFYVYRMTTNWSENTATWNSLSGGVDPGTDCDSSYLDAFPGDNDPDLDYRRYADVTSAVQSWFNGDGNYGFSIIPERITGADDGIDICSSEYVDVWSGDYGDYASKSYMSRPALEVEFSFTPLPRLEAWLDSVTQSNSNITSVDIRFTQPSNIADLISAGNITSAVTIRDAQTESQITIDSSRYSYNSATSTLTIDLSANQLGLTTMLYDTVYDIRLDCTQIHDNYGTDMFQTDDDDTDDIQHLEFCQLYGDADNNRLVDSADLVIFASDWLDSSITTGQDYDGNTKIDLIDFAHFTANWQASIE